MNPNMYNDRNVLNGGHSRPENPSLTGDPSEWPNCVDPASERNFRPLDQNTVPFYNPVNPIPSNTPFFCPQPPQQQTDIWPAWSNEQNNNPTMFQPHQIPGLNPQADPWQWSVPDATGESSQWSNPPNEQAQPHFEPFPSQMISDQSYWQQVPPPQQQQQPQQWEYSSERQSLDYESNVSADNSWNTGSWSASNETSWNPVVPQDPNLNQTLTEETLLAPPQNSFIEQPPNQDLSLKDKNIPVETQSSIISEETIQPNVEESLEQEFPPLKQNYLVENQVDEPNQEVPEPVKEVEPSSSSPSHNQPVVKSEVADIMKEEISVHQDTPNEQILCKTDSPCPIPSEKVVIKPWEGGPFQPPPPTLNRENSNDVVQQELPETVESLAKNLSTLDLNNKGEDTANMETEPDNLERPPDPNLNRVNPHHIALHKAHFGEEQDSEASNKTNLWEQPNLPNVLLLPASVSDNLSRSGSPATFSPVPATIPVLIPSASDSKTTLNNKQSDVTVPKTFETNSPLNLVELDRSPRRRPEFADKPISSVPMRESPSSQSPRGKADISSRPQSPEEPIDRAKMTLSREYDGHPHQDYREVEDVDSHYGHRSPYKNDRYYREDSINRSRPSSRASEPVGGHNYSSRYAERRDFDSGRPSREGTPSRVGVSEADLRRDTRSNEYRDLRETRDFRGSNRSLRDISDPRDLDPRSSFRDPRDADLRSSFRDPRDADLRSSSRGPRDVDIRSSSRDPRDVDLRNSSIDPRDLDSRNSSRNLNPRTSRDPRDLDPRSSARDPRDLDPRSSARDPRDLDPRSSARDPRDLDPRSSARDPRDLDPRSSARDPRDLDPRSSASNPRILDPRSSSRDPRDSRDSRDFRDSRDPRDYQDAGPRGSRIPPDTRDPRDMADYDRRSRDREYPETRGYEDERRYTRGGENDYYNRNRGYKGSSNGAYGPGYDYYQQADRYSMYYNYYNYPGNYYYGYYDEQYRTNPKYREQVDNYRAYYAQAGYDSDRMSAHSRSGRSSVNEDISKDSSRYQKDYDTGSEYSGYQASLTMDNTYNQQQDSRVESVASITTQERLTPEKFSGYHSIGTLIPGKLLVSTPNVTGTNLQIHDLQQLISSDNTIEELKLFPGPLLSGQTHKNDVIQFCQHKILILQRIIDIPDRDSQILLWELLILMLRQNGNVLGSDIAELLLKDRSRVTKTSKPSFTRQASAAGSTSSPSEDAGELPPTLLADGHHLSVNENATPSPDEGIVVSQDSRLSSGLSSNSSLADTRKETQLTIEQITEKFTEYLLFGHKKDALEWASKHGLWGHALFLASKMDSRSYVNIMTRFANSLPLNDPLQTLYQLMSGRQPYSVTRLADEKFGDWRVHLAMILSNLSLQPEVDCRSITTLGDTLAQRGCLSAAHFCYLMAQCEFGRYEQKSSKMVLLTSSHTLPFDQFASNEAIQCTEIYEYAQSLANPNFVLSNLQPYKLIYASRLAEYGFLQESLHYCEVITSLAQKSRTSFSTSLLLGVAEIAWKLKYNDPHYTQAQGEFEDISDPEWFTHLLNMSKEIIPVQNNVPPIEEQQQQQTFSQDNSAATLSPVYGTENNTTESNQTWSNNTATLDPQSQQYVQQSYQPEQPTNDWNQNQSLYQPQQTYIGNYGQPGGNQDSVDSSDQSSQLQQQQTNTFNGGETISQSLQPSAAPQASSFDYYGSVATQFQPSVSSRERQDSIGSLGYDRRGSSFSGSSTASALNTSNTNSPATSKPTPSKDNSNNAGAKKDQKGKPQAGGGGSWFGKIFGNLLPKGPNQMILPDDKNPPIVWDDKNNRWINKYDDDGNSGEAAPVAPPKDSELKSPSFSALPPLNNSNPSPPSNAAAAPPMGINRFQKPKVKNMRQNYVDVLNMNNNSNQNLNTSRFQPPPAPVDNMFQSLDTAPTSQIPNFFIPAPAPTNDGPGDFVTQGYIPVPNEDQNDNETSQQSYGSSNTPMFDPAEFSTAPKVVGNDFGHQKRSMGGGYNSANRRAYPS